MTLPRPDGFVAGLPNCGVTAIAVVSGQRYDTVWNWFKKRNNYPGQWKGRTYHTQYNAALRHFDVNFIASEWLTSITVAGFVEWHTKPNTTYMIRIAGHIFVLRNGIITDNSAKHGKPFTLFGRRKIKHVWEIIE